MILSLFFNINILQLLTLEYCSSYLSECVQPYLYPLDPILGIIRCAHLYTCTCTVYWQKAVWTVQIYFFNKINGLSIYGTLHDYLPGNIRKSEIGA